MGASPTTETAAHPAVLMRHHGPGAITRSNGAVRARSLEPEALAFAMLFRETDTALAPIVLRSLRDAGKGYSRWVMSDEDKSLLRTSSETLDLEARAQVVAAFYL